jgi:hypothetical protein
MAKGVSRRVFLGSVVGAGALAVPVAASNAAAAPTSTLYWLNPDWGARDPACLPNQAQDTCGGCYACAAHYRNKLFASAAAADAGRAHPRCKCLVQEALTVDPGTYDQLFVLGGSVDRRTPGVNELLARSTTPPGSTAPSSGVAAEGATTANGSAGGSLAFTGAPLLPLAVAGAGVVAIGAVMLRVARAQPEAVSATGSPD